MIKSFDSLGTVFKLPGEMPEVSADVPVIQPVVADDDDMRDGEYEQREAYLERLGADISADEIELDPADEDDDIDVAVDDDDGDEVIEPFDSDVVDSTEEEERSSLLAELETLATSCNYTKRVIHHAHGLSLEDLREYVRVQKRNAGGSVSVAQLIDEVEEYYADWANSELLRRKVAILEQKGQDFLVIAQRMSRVLGEDVTVSGLRFKDYHELLKHLVTHTSLVDNGVSNLAAILGIELPRDTLKLSEGSSPVIPGQALSSRETLYLLSVVANNLTFYIEHSERMEKAYTKAEEARVKAEEALKAMKENMQGVIERTSAIIDQTNKALSNTLTWVVVNNKDEYLGKIDDEVKLSFANITFYDDIRDALFFNGRQAANDFIVRVNNRFGELSAIRIVRAQ